MTKILRYVLIGVGALVLLAVLAIAAVFLLPVDVYRGQIEAAAEEATGRNLTIAGDLSLTIYPTLGITAGQVSFANAPGRAEQMAVVERLIVGVELMPLLSGDLIMTELVLEKPVINLEVDKSGNPNWRFDALKRPPDSQQTESGGEAVRSLRLGDARLSDGTIIYYDARTGSKETFEKVNARVTLPSLDDPLTIAGALKWNGEALNLDTMVKRPRAFMDGGKTQVRLKLDSAVADSSFDGALTVKTGAINGHLDLSAPSARRLAAWARSPLPEGDGFGPLKLKGVFAATGNDISFRKASIALDGMTGSGDLAIGTGGRVPSLKGTIALDRLDVNPYLGRSANAPAAPASADGGWSDAPLDFAALRAINADLHLTFGEFLVQRLKMGKSALALKINNGILTAELRELALYEGNGKGTFILDGSKATPAIRTVMTMDAVKALPLLSDAAQMSWLEGIGTLSLDVAGTGRSQAAIMRSLSGKGSLKFVDGAIKGANLAQIARTLQSVATGAALGGNLYGETAKTDFAELGGTFTIANGVLANEDLRLLNPFVRMAGKGIIDIGQRTIKYRVEPKAVGTMEGQGGKTDLAGLGVPFLVTGTWSKLSFQPDVGGVIENTLQDVLSGKGVSIPGLPGAGQQGDEAKPEDILRGLLGQPKRTGSGPSTPAPQAAPADTGPQQPQPPTPTAGPASSGTAEQPSSTQMPPVDAAPSPGQPAQSESQPSQPAQPPTSPQQADEKSSADPTEDPETQPPEP